MPSYRDSRDRVSLQPHVERLEDRALLSGAVDADPLVDFAVENSWNSGFQASLTITNDQQEELNDWQLEFDFAHEIESIWNAQIVSHNGSHYVIAPVEWNDDISIGGSVSFGFVGSGGVPIAPTDFQLEWQSAGTGTIDPGQAGQLAVDLQITNDWGSGFGANLTILNNGQENVSNWTLEFDFAHQITDIWNANIIDFSNGHYTITHAGWNDTIAAGGSISFGFNATPGNVSALPTGYLINGEPLDGAPGVPSVSVDDIQVAEGDDQSATAEFLIKLSAPATEPVVIQYATADGTAQSGADYVGATGSVTFAPGETEKVVSIEVSGDLLDEGNEHFRLVLTGASGANLVDDQATATIVDNDAAPPVVPGISINDVIVTEPAAQTGATFLHTEGNQIVDAAGNNVRIAGVNWFGFESDTFAPHGLWARNYQDMMDQMVAEGFNTIRLPFSNQLFDAGSVPNGIDFYLNPDLQGLSGIEIMDKIVDYAGEIGLRIILDHHRSNAGAGAEGSGLWYTAAYSEARWISDWQMLAERYAGNPTVIGADLHNEPHGQATWGTGNAATDWRLAAQTAGNAILEVNSEWLILVEGIGDYNGSGYWWGGNLQGAAEYPVELDLSGRLVYSPHAYPASIYHQNWFNDPNFPDNLPEIWDANWGYLFREGTAPVLLGEFGSRFENPLDVAWMEKMAEYLAGDLDGNGTHDLAAGQLGISWTYWSWNPNSGDTGGILANDWQTVLSQKVELLQSVQFDLLGTSSPATTVSFTVSLSEPTTEPVSVSFTTAAGTAIQGEDYLANTGLLTFAPGETEKTITVTVLGDDLPEGSENFLVNLSNPLGATLTDAQGVATIVEESAS